MSIETPVTPEEKLFILQLSDDCRIIARLLANELEMHLSTLKYNLDSFLEAGLIRVKQVKWSRKGRKINIYEAVERVIILLPGKKNPNTFLRNFGRAPDGIKKEQEDPEL